MKSIYKSLHARRITPVEENCFFGYYDLRALNGDLHLIHKVGFNDRLQTGADKAEIGVVDITNNHYEKLDETGAWCFQQGAMLQWSSTGEDEIIYNSLSQDDYNATILNIHTGKKRYLDRPIATVSPKGDYALSINFARSFDFRPGYGYAAYHDHFYHKNHSKDDGVFRIDLKTGKSKLIMSLDQIWELSHDFFKGNDEKISVNHITFNTDGSRFLMLVRNFPESGKMWSTITITANSDGSDAYILSDYGAQSHYFWKDRDHVIFFSDGKELDCTSGWANNYLMKDKTHEGELIGGGFFWCSDNHMSYSPDRKLLLTDTYPIDKMRRLRISNLEKNICTELGRFYSIENENLHLRCDLHPRWSDDGKKISFDSTHEGTRAVYIIDLEPVYDTLFDDEGI